ncbi:MAG: ATP-binding cassette domain-containing protein [Candidatus Limnocylindrales bacterium]
MLEIDALSERYGPITALDGASFTARRGRLTGFLGPNGSGKTTTMRCVFGLVRPEAGETRWDGRPLDAGARLLPAQFHRARVPGGPGSSTR